MPVMSFAKTVAVTFAAATLGFGASDDVEGTYHLDRAETKKAVAKLIGTQAKGRTVSSDDVALFSLVLDRLELTFELEDGGQLKMTSMPLGGRGTPGRPEVTRGIWRMDGDTILLSADGTPLPVAAGPDGFTCSKSAARLTCNIGNGVKLIFMKR
jgi:hypothetical protein